MVVSSQSVYFHGTLVTAVFDQQICRAAERNSGDLRLVRLMICTDQKGQIYVSSLGQPCRSAFLLQQDLCCMAEPDLDIDGTGPANVNQTIYPLTRTHGWLMDKEGHET